jgi:small subunit ribosomal protein S5
MERNIKQNRESKMMKSRDNSRLTGGMDKGVRRTFSPGDGQQQYDFEVLDVARVVRVVKGGRRFSFRASVVVGDRAGKVGLGMGKSRDVQSAINKAYDSGSRQMRSVALDGSTIAHEVRAKFSGSRVMLKPARPGTGIIAGGTVRLIADLAGIHDLVSKRLGSANKVNTARATLNALASLKLSKKGAKRNQKKKKTAVAGARK